MGSWTDGMWRWNVVADLSLVSLIVPEQLLQLNQILRNIDLKSDMYDTFVWNGNYGFSMANNYDRLMEVNNVDSTLDTATSNGLVSLWKYKIPSKVQLFGLILLYPRTRNGRYCSAKEPTVKIIN